MENETKTTKMELKYRSTNTTRKDILEIPKGLSEAVNRRRIDNTDKGTKRQPLVHKTLHIKLNIDQHEPL
jgi:hypothetical protein